MFAEIIDSSFPPPKLCVSGKGKRCYRFHATASYKRQEPNYYYAGSLINETLDVLEAQVVVGERTHFTA